MYYLQVSHRSASPCQNAQMRAILSVDYIADLIRRRRVKCDEAKPSCNKCTRLGIECQGYAIVKASRTARLSGNPVPIAPRYTTDIVPLLCTPESHPRVKFRNQLDYAYFQSFRQTASVLAGPFQSTLWTRVVLQASHEEPAIRALILSISALELSFNSRTDQQGLPGQKLHAHKLYALEQYDYALSAVQNIAQSKSPGALRKTLVASILIYYFENIYSGVDIAILHFLSALRCMRNELSRHSRSYCHLRAISPTPDLEDELVAEFVRLDCNILGRPDAWGTAHHVRRYILDCDFSGDVPVTFANVAEARSYLEQLEFRFLPTLTEIWAAALGSQRSRVLISASRLAICEQMSLSHQRWLAAYQPLLSRATTSRTEGPFTAELTLFIRALAAVIGAQTVWSAFEKPGDHPSLRHPSLRRDLNEDSRSVIALARIISEAPGFSRGFVWDYGVVVATFAVMMLAPRVALRREALDVMKSITPRRENTWDSTSLAKIGEEALRRCQTDNVDCFRNLRVQE